MRDFRLNANGDLDISFTMVEGRDYAAQKVGIRLRFFKGEWILDVNIGFPYFQEILGKKFDSGKFERLVTKAIITTPGILSLLQPVKATIDENRQVTVSFAADTEDGPIDFVKAFVI